MRAFGAFGTAIAVLRLLESVLALDTRAGPLLICVGRLLGDFGSWLRLTLLVTLAFALSNSSSNINTTMFEFKEILCG